VSARQAQVERCVNVAFCAGMLSCDEESRSMAARWWFVVRWCIVGAYWLASGAPVSGLQGDVIEYRLVEGRPANTLIGNVAVDAGLHTMYTAQVLTSFRYRLLPTDTDIQPGN